MNIINEDTLEIEKKVIEDFEKLLDLAELSSKEIDSLLQFREKQKMRLLFTVSTLYIFSIITFFVINYLPPEFDKEVILLALTIIGVTGLSFYLYKHFFISKKINRELRIERNIHEKLISMLDIQKQRLYENDALSSLSYAIYEIRLQRLDRTDRKIY